MLEQDNTGYFFNGRSPQKYVAQIHLEQDSLTVSVADINEEYEWRYKDLILLKNFSNGEGKFVDSKFPNMELVITSKELFNFISRKLSKIAKFYILKNDTRFLLAMLALLLISGATLFKNFDVLNQRFFPKALEKNIAAQTTEILRSEYRFCKNKNINKILDKLVKYLVKDLPNAADYQIYVIELDVENAFTWGDGQLAVSNKLLQNAASPEELLGIMAHEIGHNEKRHVVSSMGKGFIVSLLLGNVGAAQLANFLVLNSFSRHAETEADLFAIELLQQKKIDHHGLKSFFERNSNNLSAEEEKLSSYFSTHPASKERIKLLDSFATSDFSGRRLISDRVWRYVQQGCHNWQ